MYFVGLLFFILDAVEAELSRRKTGEEPEKSRRKDIKWYKMKVVDVVGILGMVAFRY